MNDSDLHDINEARIKTHIHSILQNIKILENKSLQGEKINYLANIYVSMLVLEDYYPDIHSQCIKELSIDYKEIAELYRKLTPNLSPKKIKLLEGIINRKIENVIKKISDIKEFILQYFKIVIADDS